MGCDIHAHSEVKINGTWHHLSVLDIDRSYSLFTRMAGVRSCPGVEPISDPRGMPEDASFITRYDCDKWGIDGHSHSWLSAAEVADLGEWLEAQHKKHQPEEWWCCEMMLGCIFGNGWDQFTKYRDDLREGLEDARLVFWFDS